MKQLLKLFRRKPNPARIAGLKLWFDAADAPTLAFNGATISQWNDKSGLGNHAVQATGSRQPKYIAAAIRGKPALEGRHDGTNASQLAVADHASLDYTEFNVFCVFTRLTDLGATEHIGGKYSPTGNLREHRMVVGVSGINEKLALQATTDGTGGTVASTDVTSPAIAIGTPYIGEASYGSGSLSLRVNNGTAGTAALASVFNGSFTYSLFSRESFSEPFAGYIGEYLFYARALTASERQTVYKYLSKKWGVS